MNALTRKIGPFPAYVYVGVASALIIAVAYWLSRNRVPSEPAVTVDDDEPSDASEITTGIGNDEWANLGQPAPGVSGSSGTSITEGPAPISASAGLRPAAPVPGSNPRTSWMTPMERRRYDRIAAARRTRTGTTVAPTATSGTIWRTGGGAGTIGGY